jgi:hypothetical protein
MAVISHYMSQDTILQGINKKIPFCASVKMLFFVIRTLCVLIINFSKIFEKSDRRDMVYNFEYVLYSPFWIEVLLLKLLISVGKCQIPLMH